MVSAVNTPDKFSLHEKSLRYRACATRTLLSELSFSTPLTCKLRVSRKKTDLQNTRELLKHPLI